jgi:hypothetical protein
MTGMRIRMVVMLVSMVVPVIVVVPMFRIVIVGMSVTIFMVVMVRYRFERCGR